MKTSRFLSVAAIAAALVLSLTGGKALAQKDYYDDAGSLGSTSGDYYNYWQSMDMNYAELYTNYYQPRVSQYNDNLSKWSTWSSYATYAETAAINAILAGQNDLLDDMASEFSNMNSCQTGANSAYSDFVFWYNQAGPPKAQDSTEAQNAWDAVKAWAIFNDEFHEDTGEITNDVIDFDENYQPYFDSILQDIINRNS